MVRNILFVLCLFPTREKCVLSNKKIMSLIHFPSPQPAHAPPGAPPITSGSITFRVFYGGFCDVTEKPSQLSSKMPIGGPAGAHPSKKGRQSRAKRRLSKKPLPLCGRMVIFDPAASKKAIPCENGEGEGRLASQNTWFWSHSRPQIGIPCESGEKGHFFRR